MEYDIRHVLRTALPGAGNAFAFPSLCLYTVLVGLESLGKACAILGDQESGDKKGVMELW